MNKKKLVISSKKRTHNSSWKIHMNTIRNLGIPENGNIFNLVRISDPQRVLNSIELYRELKRETQIIAPVDTFYLMLKDGWMDKSAVKILNDKTMVYERRAIFSLWFKYMERIGRLTGYKDVDSKRMVYKDKEPCVSFVTLWKNGWTLEYLQNNFEF